MRENEKRCFTWHNKYRITHDEFVLIFFCARIARRTKFSTNKKKILPPCVCLCIDVWIRKTWNIIFFIIITFFYERLPACLLDWCVLFAVLFIQRIFFLREKKNAQNYSYIYVKKMCQYCMMWKYYFFSKNAHSIVIIIFIIIDDDDDDKTTTIKDEAEIDYEEFLHSCGKIIIFHFIVSILQCCLGVIYCDRQSHLILSVYYIAIFRHTSSVFREILTRFVSTKYKFYFVSNFFCLKYIQWCLIWACV